MLKLSSHATVKLVKKKAKVAYIINDDCQGELAAEALYYDAYFKNKDENLKLQTQQFKISKELF
jgi:hypothetical protein